MTAAGVDYGLRRVAVSVPTQGVFEEIALSGSDDVVADIEVLADWLCDVLIATRPKLVAVERPIQGASRNVRVGLGMAMVAGTLATTARRSGSQAILVEPATWKKAVTGRGNSDKEAVKEWLALNHPDYRVQCLNSQDLIDATCMALFAQEVLARGSSV